jgi:hypothetical protein
VSWSNWATVADLGTALGWHFYPDWRHEDAHAPLDEFRRQTRDLYIPVGDIGFWQGALREPGIPATPPPARSSRVASLGPSSSSTATTGGQRCVTRFTMRPSSHITADTDPDPAPTWFASQSRNWNIDRPDPR